MTVREQCIEAGLVLVRYEAKFMGHPWEEVMLTSYEILWRSEGYKVRKVYLTADGEEVHVEGYEDGPV
jgi:hypothetical protein